MASRPQISLLDKLSFVTLAGKAFAAVLSRFVTGFFHSGIKADTRFKDAVFAGMRFLSDNITVAQETWNNETNTTLNGYLTYARRNSFEPSITELKSGLKLCWIGPKNASKVLLYFHGGGYVSGASPGHVSWAADLQKTCSEHTSFSVVFVAYTLATPTGGRYPIQLQEAAEALYWLTETKGKKPSDIIVGGDSAGGHLVISLLSHLLHPHPEATKIELREPLRSVILISPWVSFQVNDESYTRNACSDFLTPTSLQRWSSMYRHTSAPDNYNEPVRADGAWFLDLEKVAEDALIWAGRGELFVDSIREIANTVQAAHPEVQFVVRKGASHVALVVDRVLGYGKTEDDVLVEEWVLERI